MPSLELSEGAIGKLLFFLLRWLITKNCKLIAQTPEMRDDLIKIYNVSLNNVRVINNPLDKNSINTAIRSEKNPFNEKNINFVASGRLYEPKGYDILIKAFSICCKKREDFRLHIIGSDIIGKKKFYKNLADELGCLDKIIFHGHIDNPYPFYKYSDVFVLSSRREGMPNALIENIYLSKKVISSNCIPAIKRILDSSKCGEIYNVNDFNELANCMLNYELISTGNLVGFDTLDEFKGYILSND